MDRDADTLTPPEANAPVPNNLLLIGFMGSGKTAVGRRLAQRLGYAFLDTDHFIEREAGCTIAELFEVRGELAFREMESALAGRLALVRCHVVATGGGLPCTPGNMERLKRAGVVVFLKAAPEDLLVRLSRDTRRPKLREGESLEATIERLMGERLPIYEQADLVVETHGKSVNRVAGEIIANVSAARARKQGAAETEVAENP